MQRACCIAARCRARSPHALAPRSRRGAVARARSPLASRGGRARRHIALPPRPRVCRPTWMRSRRASTASRRWRPRPRLRLAWGRRPAPAARAARRRRACAAALMCVAVGGGVAGYGSGGGGVDGGGSRAGMGNSRACSTASPRVWPSLLFPALLLARASAGSALALFPVLRRRLSLSARRRACRSARKRR